MVDPHPSDSIDHTGYYVGVMSGTSMDAVDAVLVEFLTADQLRTVSTLSTPFPKKLRADLISLIQPDWTGSLAHIAKLDAELGIIYGQLINTLLEQSGIPKHTIKAIGNHGQTVCHQPNYQPSFSWQLGDASRIVELTGVTTIANFRSRDVAAGGEGAPLVPAFHQAMFSDAHKTRVVLNIGGIANISFLSPHTETIGFDTGPGNALLDAWCLEHQGLAYDKGGNWAAQGQIRPMLLKKLMALPYLARPYPKSTGKEAFNLSWLRPMLESSMDPTDIQATLLEFTALSIRQGIDLVASSTDTQVDEIYVCGGGAKNSQLMKRLKELSGHATVAKTDQLGISADWVEATAFAWLARQTLLGLPGNLPSATGASDPRVLGAIHAP